MVETLEETINQVRNKLGVCRGLLCVATDAGDLDEVISLLGDTMVSVEGLSQAVKKLEARIESMVEE